MSTPFVNPDDPIPESAQPYPEKTYLPAPPAPRPQPAYGVQQYAAWAPPVYAAQPKNALATAGLVVGILGACFFWFPGVNFILAVLAIIFGGVGWNTSTKNGIGKGRAISAVALGVVTLVGWFVFWAAVLSAAGTAGTAALG